jgi:hypothetical protein
MKWKKACHNRNVLQLVDECAVYNEGIYRDNVHLLELLQNTARCMHPLDAHITQNIKTVY